MRSSPGIGPLTAALSAVRAPRVADKSKPPPCRRETREIRAASLDHLNDPLPRGSSANSGGMSSLATGHAPMAANVFAALHSPLHARPRRRSSILDIRSFASSLRALGLSTCRAPPVPRRNSFSVYFLAHSTLGSSRRIWACSGVPDCGEIARLSPWPRSESF